MEIDHIGYLVKDIDKSRSVFENLGFRAEGACVFDEFRGIDILFMVNDNYRIELVSPKTDTSIVANLIKRLGNSPYHICYRCRDLSEKMNELKAMRFIPMCEPAAAPAFNGNRVVFLFNKNIGIIELVENNDDGR